MQTLIRISEDAVKEVLSLISEENNLELKLRVYITGGGCSGFKYAFAFDEITRAEVAVIKIVEKNKNQNEPLREFNILIDPLSLQYLRGANIDYRRDISGSKFTITNPNAKTTCGCGSSFST